MMNCNGNITEGVFAALGETAEAVFAGAGLTVVDMDNKASIRLFLGFAGEAAFFELRVKKHGTPVSMRGESHSFRQSCHCFQNSDQWFWWFKSARIYFQKFRVHKIRIQKLKASCA